MASLVGAEPGNVIFTSGGTESDNLAIDGVLGAKGGQALCSATEHPAVLEPVRESGGIVAPTDDTGRVDLESLANILDSFNDILKILIHERGSAQEVIDNIEFENAMLSENISTSNVSYICCNPSFVFLCSIFRCSTLPNRSFCA